MKNKGVLSAVTVVCMHGSRLPLVKVGVKGIKVFAVKPLCGEAQGFAESLVMYNFAFT